MLGGYMLIDLKGVDLTVDGESKKVEGLYARLEGNYGKVLVFGHLKIDGVEKPERVVSLGLNGTTYEGNAGINSDGNGLFIHITQDDMVSLTEQ